MCMDTKRRKNFRLQCDSILKKIDTKTNGRTKSSDLPRRRIQDEETVDRLFEGKVKYGEKKEKRLTGERRSVVTNGGDKTIA